MADKGIASKQLFNRNSAAELLVGMSGRRSDFLKELDVERTGEPDLHPSLAYLATYWFST